MADFVLLVAGAVLILDGRTLRILVAYIVLAATVSIFILPSALASPLSLTLFAMSVLLKLVIAPIGILLFVRANPPATDLLPSIPLPARFILVIAFAIVSRAVGHFPTLAAIPQQGLVAYVILCSVGMLIVHRNLLAHLMGLLALGAGITFAAATLAPTLPEFVELGASFDALVATVLGLTLVRSLIVHSPILDVESLRRLRG
jgi:hydrogenase-4 component E